MAIVAVALLVATVLIGSCSAQEPTDYLKVKGKVIGSNATDVQVFEYDDVECKWVQTYEKERKSSYSLRLATDKEYQIFFTASNGAIKTIHIHSGEPGLWVKMLDIDFEKTSNLKAMMYQNEDKDDYDIRVIPYTNVFAYAEIEE